MKGIILAGGTGSRLYPVTKAIVKQLLPIYDKPMIYYPLSILMLAGLREVLIISTPQDIDRFKELLGDGCDIGMSLSYEIQPKPEGIAQALIIGEDFLNGDDVALVLGDNIFYGHGLTDLLSVARKTVQKQEKAVIFGYYVKNPWDYGVVEFDEKGDVLSIEEKPKSPKSNWAVVGLYFYPNDAVEIAKDLEPSDRGELEISSVNQIYLSQNRLKVELLGRGYAWLDTGTFENLLEASKFIEIIEKRQGLKVACIEEIAYQMGFIDAQQLKKLAVPLMKSRYGEYLLKLLKERA